MKKKIDKTPAKEPPTYQRCNKCKKESADKHFFVRVGNIGMPEVKYFCAGCYYRK